MQTVTGRRACDGPSCCPSHSSETQISTKGLWRSVTPVTVRPAIPSQSSESRFSVPNFRFSKCFETRPCDGPSCPWRYVVGSVASASFSRIEVCCSKRLNGSLQQPSEFPKGPHVQCIGKFHLLPIIMHLSSHPCYYAFLYYHSFILLSGNIFIIDNRLYELNIEFSVAWWEIVLWGGACCYFR